jgi:hypothetical protein
MSRLRKGLLGLLLSVGLMGGFGASGYAYLGQYLYDDSNPTATHDPYGNTCAAGAYTPNGYSISVSNGQTRQWGTLELRYSPGCGTAWARFTCTGYWGCNNYHLRITRDNPDGAYIDDHVTDGTPKGGQVYYLQVNDAGSFRSRACWVADGYGWQCTADF